MIHGRTDTLVTALIALTLLLMAPIAIAALESNPVTGGAMRSFEGTPIGQLVGVFSADAEAALSRQQQLDKAAGQASYYCFRWTCSSRQVTAYWWSGSTLDYRYTLYGVRNVWGNSNCRTARMRVVVYASGGYTDYMVSCT